MKPKNQSRLGELIKKRKEREEREKVYKRECQKKLAIFKIKFKAVYQYRNRWVFGIIEGELDMFARTFTQIGKKKGIKMIKDSNTALDIQYIIKDYIPLRHFLTKKIAVKLFWQNIPSQGLPHITPCRTESLIQAAWRESKYLERLVLKGAKVNRMWVDHDSIVLNNRL